MRAISEISAQEENLRLVSMGAGMSTLKRDMVQPEPIGTVVLLAFRVTGYSQDCDGSAMAHLEQITKDGDTTGWTENAVGLYPDSGLVVTQDELLTLFK